MRVPKKNAFSGEVTHPDRNKHSSDWSVNSFKMVINEEFFSGSEFSVPEYSEE